MVTAIPKVNRVITFYSYKGGVGRSMAMANIGVLLAGWGYKTLLIDWDLEAPGMESYFKGLLQVTHVQQKQGLIDLLTLKHKDNEIDVKDLDWPSYITPINANKGHTLHLLTAGKRDAGYFNKVREFDYNSFYSEAGGGQYLEDLREMWLQQYNFILIDSRTGLTDSSGICSIQMPDILVLLFTPNNQSFNGIKEVAQKAINGQKQIVYDRFRLRVLPVPCRIENAETILLDEWMEKIYAESAGMLEWLPRKETNLDEYMLTPAELIGQLKVPYKTLYAYGERLAVTERGTNDPQDLGYVYESIAAVLANDLQHIHLVKDARDLLIKKAKGEEVVDYTELERKYADQQQVTTKLAEELTRKETFIQDKTIEIKKRRTRFVWVVLLSFLALIVAAFFILPSLINNNMGTLPTGNYDSIDVVTSAQGQAADFATTYSTSPQQAELGFNLQMAEKYSHLTKAYQDTLADIKSKIEFAIAYRFQDIADSFYRAARENPATLSNYFADTVREFGGLRNMPAANLAGRILSIAKNNKISNKPADTTFNLKLDSAGFKVMYTVTGNTLLDSYTAFKQAKTSDSFLFNYAQKIVSYQYHIIDSIPLNPPVQKTVVEVFFCPSNDKQSYSRGNAIVNGLKANPNFTVSSKSNFYSSPDPSSPYYFQESQIRYNGNDEFKIATIIQQIIQKSAAVKIRMVPARTPTKNYLSVFLCDNQVAAAEDPKRPYTSDPKQSGLKNR